MQQFQTSLLDKDTLLQIDGSLFIGTIIKGFLQGFGLLFNPDGSYYYGEFNDSKPINVGIYKLRNSSIKLIYSENSELIESENIYNQTFLHKVIPFKNNVYGNKILIRRYTDRITYGIGKKGEFHGFCIQHHKNGDIFYGQIENNKKQGDAINYSSKKQQWFWVVYQNDIQIKQKFYGDNFVPRELIIELFCKIHKTNQNFVKTSSLSNIQYYINNSLINFQNANDWSIKEHLQISDRKHNESEKVEFENDEGDPPLAYNESIQKTEEEIQNYLTKQETEQAIQKVNRSFSCLITNDKNSQIIEETRINRTNMVPTKIVYRRSLSPVLTTIRPLFSILRI